VLLRQLLDPETSTWTYLLADDASREAVLIDPVREQVARDIEQLEQLGLRLLYALETHVHADHVTGGGELRRRLGCRLVVGARAGVLTADLRAAEGDAIRVGRHTLVVRETPGHTAGCVSYVCLEQGLAFTGDALLIRGCGRTDFQQGDARTLYASVRGKLLSLPDETRLYPGHDYRGRTVTTVAEERRHNPRLGDGRSVEQFVELMAGLELPYPRRMDEAVPANLASGVTEPEALAPGAPGGEAWAPVRRTESGVPVVTCEWLAGHRDEVQLVDVREHVEFCGPLGHIEGAVLVPLATLEEAAADLDRTLPVVTACAFGTRSATAATLLRARGFPKVASLHGGMVRWNEAGLPVVEVMGDRGHQDVASWQGMNI
jgi:glyoxylase-like metal-dependent hydrolase (beta-lactamase superfamily II)/rhodanese-related sulfurtransferase